MENYYDNSSRWVFDSDGEFLHSKRRVFNPNIEREGYFFSNTKEVDDDYFRYLLERENNND